MTHTAFDYFQDSIGSSPQAYYPGERVQRPWGYYEVLDIGTCRNFEYCKKRIVINPGQALSLQRHHGRREFLHISEGDVFSILDARLYKKRTGDHMDVPLHGIHSLINLSERPAVIYEKQEGFCREDDNERLCDFYGRPVAPAPANDSMALASIRLYKNVTEFLNP